MSFDLTQNQRSRIFNGDAPNIAGRGKCEAIEGESYPLSNLVSLKIVRIRTRPAQATDQNQDPHWSLLYEIHDRRDKVRNLRRTPQAQDFAATKRSFDEFGYPPEFSEAEQELGAEGSAYTSSSTSLSDAGEAVDKESQKRFSMESEQDRIKRKKDAELRLKQRSLSARLIELESAMQTHPNLARYMHRIERQVSAAEARQRREAA